MTTLLIGKSETTHVVFGSAEAAGLSWSATEDAVNEDGALMQERDGRVLLAVSDGMGGGPGGERATKAALERVSQGFADGEPLGVVIEAASDAVRALRGPRCALVVAVIEDDTLHTFHVGDAQALVVGGRGKMKGITMPHSVVGHATEAGLLSEEDAAEHPDRNIVTNIVGDEVIRIERMRWLPLAPRDTLLLASDGLFDAVPIADVLEESRSGDAVEIVERLANRARAADIVPDDLTIVIFRGQ